MKLTIPETLSLVRLIGGKDGQRQASAFEQELREFIHKRPANERMAIDWRVHGVDVKVPAAVAEWLAKFEHTVTLAAITAGPTRFSRAEQDAIKQLPSALGTGALSDGARSVLAGFVRAAG